MELSYTRSSFDVFEQSDVLINDGNSFANKGFQISIICSIVCLDKGITSVVVTLDHQIHINMRLHASCV